MAEKILGLLSAFVLGGVVGFYYFVWVLKMSVKHNLFGLRVKLRSLLERYEPPYNRGEPLFTLSSDRVSAVRGGYYEGLERFHIDYGLAIQRGLRAVSGRCDQCGSSKDVQRGQLTGGFLCRACIELWCPYPPP